MKKSLSALSFQELKTNPVKLALFDIDGTLLYGTHTIPKDVIEQIQRIRQLGVAVGLATGRPYFSSRWIAELLDIDQPCMFCSGSLICRPLSGDILFANYLVPNETLSLIECLLSDGFHLELYTKDNYYIDSFNELADIHQQYMNQAAIIRPLKLIATQHDLLKAVVMVRRGEQEQRLRTIMNSLPHYETAISSGEAHKDILFFNIANKSASRTNAFDFFVTHYQISPDNVAAFGDAESDREFLTRAGYGVAMGNAAEPVKNIASYVTETVHNSGVAHALKILIRNF